MGISAQRRDMGICPSVGCLRFECPTADITGPPPTGARERTIPTKEWTIPALAGMVPAKE